MSDIQLSLKGKVALIGGSSQGIGWEIAKLYALAGAKCILMARNQSKLAARIEELNKISDVKHEYVVVNLRDTASLLEVLAPVLDNNTIDILVNNSGGPAGGPLIDAAPKALEDAFAQHVIANQVLTAAVVPTMQKKQWGRVINIISTSVKVPLTGLGVSNTIRAAVGNWAKTLANELGKDGITVNNVLPGATATTRLEEIINNRSEKQKVSYDEVAQKMQSEIPIGRFAKPEEIAFAALYLASTWADSINGINLPVDGGRTPNL